MECYQNSARLDRRTVFGVTHQWLQQNNKVDNSVQNMRTIGSIKLHFNIP